MTEPRVTSQVVVQLLVLDHLEHVLAAQCSTFPGMGPAELSKHHPKTIKSGIKVVFWYGSLVAGLPHENADSGYGARFQIPRAGAVSRARGVIHAGARIHGAAHGSAVGARIRGSGRGKTVRARNRAPGARIRARGRARIRGSIRL